MKTLTHSQKLMVCVVSAIFSVAAIAGGFVTAYKVVTAIGN